MFAWTVYPSSSSAPMIATGATDDGDEARKVVEAVLSISDGGFGMVIENGLHHQVCRRADLRRGPSRTRRRYIWCDLHAGMASLETFRATLSA